MSKGLKAKNLPASSGAEFLAEKMAGIHLENKPLREISIHQLYDAPKEWNFFQPLPDSKFFELLESMEEKGLLVPLIVQERPDGGYLILSGHNRKRAAKELFEKKQDFRFEKLACQVYALNELNDDEARSILVDCNWVQRILSPSEKARAIQLKYIELGRRKKGEQKRTYDLVAEHFGLKATQVYQYYKLSQLESTWLDKINNGSLSIKAAAHLASLSSAQRETLLKSTTELKSAQILTVKPSWSKEQIRDMLKNSNQSTRMLSVEVPIEKYDEILKMILKIVQE